MLDLIFVALFQAAAGPAEAPAPAPQADQTDAAAVAESAPAANPSARAAQPLRCRRELITGTRLSRRVCTTPAEDQEITDETRDFVNRAQSQVPLQGN